MPNNHLKDNQEHQAPSQVKVFLILFFSWLENIRILIVDIFLSATCNLRDCIKSQDRASFCCKRNFNARCCYYATGYNNYRPNYINNYIPHNDYGPWQNLGNNHPYNSNNIHSFIYRKEIDLNHATYCRSLASRKTRILSASKISG